MNIFKQMKIILWAFLGVRSSNGKEEDLKIVKNPLFFLGIGFLLFIVFIILLIIIVHLVV